MAAINYQRHEEERLRLEMYRALRNDIPQLNDKTKVAFVERGMRAIDIPIADQEPITAMNLLPKWYPKAGIKALLTRIRARVHKWLVDNRYHPADRPKGWRALDISRYGMIDINPGASAIAPRVATRRIEFKPYASRMGFDFGAYNEIYVVVAYDGLTDTLYIQR